MITTLVFAEREFPSVYVCGSSMQGDRSYQQDALFYKRKGNGVLAAVCDGMGGMENGELASAEALRVLEQKFSAQDRNERIPVFLMDAAIEMDRVVSGLKNRNGNAIRSGATFTAAYTIKNRLYWMSIGDSRLYLYRDGVLRVMTTSHNYGQWVKKNPVEAKRAAGGSDANPEALTSYIGMNGIRFFDYNETPFLMKEGDIILLCTDGLYKALPGDGIEQIMEACEEDFDRMAEVLVDTAHDYGVKPLDNCTAVLLKYHEED